MKTLRSTLKGIEPRRLVGDNDLVFTNLTGVDLNLHSGWNSYAGISQRQIYLAGWYNTKLRNNMNELSALLNNNQMILHGVLTPDQIHLSKKYENYYAVTSLDFSPVGFLEIYRNEQYAISRYIKK
jgi:hypothetical protein